MDGTTAGEHVRRVFLSNLLARVGDGDGRLLVEYLEIAPFKRLGARLRVQGVPGNLILVPISMVDGARLFDSFPGPGVPHVILYTTRSDTQEGLPGLAAQLCTNDIERLVSAIRRWRDASLPKTPLIAPPLTAESLRPLRALAAVHKTLATAATVTAARERGDRWQALGLVDGLQDEQHTLLTPEARAQFASDIAHLDPLRLLSSMPRDERGRLELGATVLLACYETIEPQRPTYQLWLAAQAPERRRDPQVVTLKLRPLITANHPLRWDSAPWLWDARGAAADEATRWGVAELPVAELGLERREEHLARLEQLCGPGRGAMQDRVALCILLQDAGRLEEALALWEVDLAPEVLDILRGGAGRLESDQAADRWTHFLQEQLRGAALWRFAAITAAEAARLRAWAAAKRGRRFRAPRQRLFALPHQTQQSKASLILVGAGPEGNDPRLEIEGTASNARLAEPLWRRPLDLDLARFGLL